MAIISLRVPDDELNILKSYAKINNCSLSEIIRSTMLTHIENEYDIKTFSEYEKEKESGNLKTREVSELWNELGL